MPSHIILLVNIADLINDYKNTHGDIPSSSSQWDRYRRGSRWGRGYGSHLTQSYSALPQPYVPHSSGSWRKTYSLNNKTTGATGRHVSHPYQHVSTLNQPSHHINSTSTVTDTRDNTGLNRSNEKVPEEKNKSISAAGLLQSETSQKRNTASEQRTVLISSGQRISHSCASTNNPVDSTLSSLGKQSESEKKIKPTLNPPLSVTNPTVSSPAKQKPETQLQIKPYPPSAALPSRTVVMPKAQNDSSVAPSDSSFQSYASSNPTKLVQKPDSCHKRSQFTWVKKQEVVNLKNIPKTNGPIETSASPAPGSSSETVNVRRLSGSNKRISRKPGLSGSPKTSKYTWVSSSCSSSTAGKTNTLTKQLRKPLSPKSYKVPVKTAQCGLEGTKKRNATSSSVVSKKSRTASTSHVGHTSRYSWKAAGQGATANTSSSVPRSAHKNTVYQWVANKGQKRPAFSLSPAHSSTPTTHKSLGAFKLRSRTKIIRRSPNT